MSGLFYHYIGVRVDRGQGYYLKPIVIPLEELGRPRIDVTVNICGFFRDLFPHLVRFLDLAFQTVAHLDEPPEQNFIRRHTRAMAKATELVSGRRPAVLIADTTRERIQVKTLAEAVRHGVTSRLFNPRWIDGMLRHAHQGAQGIADRVEYLIGLDATTSSVGTATWHKVAQHFVFDGAMRERLMQNNPFAEAEIIRQLAQAHGRGYWQATPEERKHLDEIYMEIEYRIEAGEG